MGTLTLVATPIGNIDDISIRAIRVLFSASRVLCEDTRNTGFLLSEVEKRYGAALSLKRNENQKLIRFDIVNEMSEMPQVIEDLKHDISYVLVSDAGTPLINDPGYLLVQACIKRSIPVTCIPGPVAAVAALSLSGLPSQQFMYLGYFPEKAAHQVKLLQSLVTISTSIQPTYIAYVSPHKMQTNLVSMLSVFGDIPIVFARELTKMYEEVWRGTVKQAMEVFAEPKGEFVMLFRLEKSS